PAPRQRDGGAARDDHRRAARIPPGRARRGIRRRSGLLVRRRVARRARGARRRRRTHGRAARRARRARGDGDPLGADLTGSRLRPSSDNREAMRWLPVALLLFLAASTASAASLDFLRDGRLVRTVDDATLARDCGARTITVDDPNYEATKHYRACPLR